MDVTPWTAADMKAKGCRGNAEKAARQANHILATCQSRGGRDCERIAIATALKHANAGMRRKKP